MMNQTKKEVVGRPTGTMNLAQFKTTLDETRPHDALPVLLKALWFDARGDWHRAHQITQDEPGREAAWVHAYLHRKEGDSSNAAYWYRQAGRPVCSDSLEQEWESLVEHFL